MNSGITLILVQVLKLINFMINGEKGPQKRSAMNSFIQSDVPERSAQRLAMHKLDKTIKDVYILLKGCIIGNGKAATAILSKRY